jgi:hypothetical protein
MPDTCAAARSGPQIEMERVYTGTTVGLVRGAFYTETVPVFVEMICQQLR